jgi:ketosteroid isomerase-like protein
MTGTEDSGSKTQIIQRMHDWKATFESKDADGMMSFYAPDDAFSAFDLMPPIQFHGGDQWRQNWVNFFSQWTGTPKLEFSDMEAYAAGDLSFVRLLVRLVGTMTGQQLDIWVRQTNCFRRIEDEWLMIHDHVSVPTDFATGQSLLGLSPAKPFG